MNGQTIGVGFTMNLERVFDAPRQLVFDCFTKEEHMREWWGPRHFTNPTCELDARAGGKIRIDMLGPPPFGLNPMIGEFIEVEPPSRLVFTAMAHQGADGVWGIDNINTLTFEDAPGGKTRLLLETVVRKVSPEIMPALNGMQAGWTQSFDKLEEHIAAVTG
jgi:uncharacterized protein YndB with AHSA1/START domain